MGSFHQDITYTALKATLEISQGRRYRGFLRAASEPRAAQEATLRRILATNSGTVFGQKHDFASIATVNEYRRAVPVQTYEDLRPYIERQERSGEPCLTTENPVYYQRTSGTSDKPKNIPLTASGLHRIRKFQMLSAYAQYKGSAVFRGKVFGITGAAVEGKMPGGTPYGSASGLIYEKQSRFVRSKYVLPAQISAIDDYETRYLVMARLAVAEADVSGISTANPSTLLKIITTINENIEPILQSIASGRLPVENEDTAGLESELQRVLKANPDRARTLSRIAERSGGLSYADLWPDLSGIVTWTGGSCGVPLQALRNQLPDGTKIIELGYVASEFRGTINMDVAHDICIPTLSDNFFEFVERSAWEQGTGEFLTLHEIEAGKEYYIFVTTPDGLYRYDMNDIVRATDVSSGTLGISFIQKGQGVTNITGEKLHETQVIDAVLAMTSDHGIQSDFFVMLADEEDASYTLFIEPKNSGGPVEARLSEELDGRLRALNIEYGGKRESGRLKQLRICALREGTGDAYRHDRIANGQRDAQFKFLHLQYRHKCTFDFDAFSKADDAR